MKSYTHNWEHIRKTTFNSNLLLSTVKSCLYFFFLCILFFCYCINNFIDDQKQNKTKKKMYFNANTHKTFFMFSVSGTNFFFLFFWCPIDFCVYKIDKNFYISVLLLPFFYFRFYRHSLFIYFVFPHFYFLFFPHLLWWLARLL